MSSKVDVVVIGAGPAGAMAAARAVELGASTALVTQNDFGGMAANDGPVPVRTLAHTARLMRDARQLGRYGVTIDEPVLDYSRMLERVGEVVTDVRTVSSLPKQIESRGATVYENAGRASFVDSHTIVTETGLHLQGDKIILCTGGVSKSLPIPGFECTSTHSDAWGLTSVPPSIIIVGAGATGAQVASIFNTFGSHIDLFEATPHILPTEDDDVAAAVADAFRQGGIEVHEKFGAIESFEKTPNGVRMTFSKDDQRHTVEATLAVVAVGWAADTQTLNLAAAGVDVTERGFLKVNGYLQTTVPHIFAAGDVTGRVMLASEGLRDGFVAATNALQDSVLPVSDHVIPAGSFTDPEYASVGLTERKARESHDVVTAVVDFGTVTRAIIDGQTFGFCKLIVDRKTTEILGCHVVGERAVDIVQVASVALAAGMRRVDDLARVAISFPSYAHILINAAVKAALQLNLDVGWHAHEAS
ncbi:pyruvate/2-oxoglutarate dehydrogenase complex, dihydrolipoamide dehydrogenase component [Mycobacterium sp. JS623]|uniref:dihydrolipoyl dehydrogenase family protein n=1 Tax=Mycobacterium sp. JS623 TaxID=212767 RepID=UPI0002A58A7B|nr:NAD(P)/FAD-dependent oxidoreductase [Mycobacterium sp. JS623]AGB24592.1 pyruvate/2-oxoglutarate dehydrogenase complex, dihydrolipoamide dehydrogenase component [Mycobacterium sp. JS623]